MHTYILIYILFVNLRKYLIINNNIYHTLFVIEYVNSKLNYIIFIKKIFKYYQGFNEFDACLRNFKYINEHLSSRNDVYEYIRIYLQSIRPTFILTLIIVDFITPYLLPSEM